MPSRKGAAELKKKLSARRGFTVVELLAVTAVLVLMAALVSVGVGVAGEVYAQGSFAAESAVLEDSLNAALGDLLRHATYNGIGEAGQVSFTNRQYYEGSAILAGHLVAGYDTLMVNTGGGEADDNEPGSLRELISIGTYAGHAVRNFELAYNGGVYSGSYSIEAPGGRFRREVTFSIRSLGGEAE